MKAEGKILFASFVLWLCVISCSDRYYKASDFVGVFNGKRTTSDMEGEYPWTDEEWRTGVVTYPTEFDSVREERRRGIMAYLQGDTGSRCFPYAVHHKLKPGYLCLEKEGTFRIGFGEFQYGDGVWRLKNNDTIKLEFKSYYQPKDTSMYISVMMDDVVYEGVRNLKILNKDLLQFEYFLFNKKTRIKMMYKRLKAR